MTGPSADDRLVRYLLGDVLTDAEQSDFEERYFTDDSCFARVLAAEDDLIDRYLRGRLFGDDVAVFERNFLASARRRTKWEARKAIAPHSRSPAGAAGPGPSLLGFLGSLAPATRLFLAASSLAFAGCVALLGWRYVDLRKQTFDLQSRLETLERRPQDPGVAEFVLPPERFRSGGSVPLQITADARWVVLKIELPPLFASYSSFAAALSTVEGDEIWRQSSLASAASSIEIDLPARALKRGDYVLSVSVAAHTGEIKLPSYQFRIDR